MRECCDCEYEDLPSRNMPCKECTNDNDNFLAKGAVETRKFAEENIEPEITLESINAKLDVIMAHLGIVG